MAWRDLRAFLDGLGGGLRRVAEPFSPRFEIAAALREARADALALLDESIEGHPGWRVYGNLMPTASAWRAPSRRRRTSSPKPTSSCASRASIPWVRRRCR